MAETNGSQKSARLPLWLALALASGAGGGYFGRDRLDGHETALQTLVPQVAQLGLSVARLDERLKAQEGSLDEIKARLQRIEERGRR